MNLKRVSREGLVAGMIGAAAIATWFLIVDSIAREPFFTPAMLGSALFWGLRDPGAVQISFQAVVGYTVVHALTFVLVGMTAAALACQVERAPSTLFIVVVLFAAFAWPNLSSARWRGGAWPSATPSRRQAWGTICGTSTPSCGSSSPSTRWAHPSTSPLTAFGLCDRAVATAVPSAQDAAGRATTPNRKSSATTTATAMSSGTVKIAAKRRWSVFRCM